MKKRAANSRTQLKMNVDHECSIVLLTKRQVKELYEDPYSFAVNPTDIVARCGVKHQVDSQAQKKCFAAFHPEIPTAW